MSPKAAKGRISRLVAASRGYLLQVSRLGTDIFQRFPVATIKILVAGGASLACQVFTVAALYIYLKALEGNEAIVGLASRDSPALFAVVAVVIFILLNGFAVLAYRANIATLSLCRQYQNMGTQEALSLAGKLPHWFLAINEQHISERHLRQLLAIDVHHRSRLARLLILSIIPAARLIVCTAALFYINPGFSALILIVVGIPILGLYSVGQRVADTITTRETPSASVFKQQRLLLDKSWKQKSPLLPREIDWEVTLGQPDSRYRLYFRRLRAKAQGVFLIDAANTLGIMVLVLSLGFMVMNEQQNNWSLWLTYMVALRYFLSSLRSISQSVIRSARFIRQSQRFTEFVSSATRAMHSPDPCAAPCPKHVCEAFKGNSASSTNGEDLDDD